MLVEEFSRKLILELKNELPGFSAQSRMDPIGRNEAGEYLNAKSLPKKSAVMILVYPNAGNSQIHSILIIRSENERGSHAGQISFPGGGFEESDVNLAYTALRETEEEIGVDRNTIEIIGELSPVFIPVSNYLVSPFVGICHQRPVFKKHALEVDDLLEVQLVDLLMEENRTTAEIFLKLRNRTMKVPCFNIGGKIIWGATAMIISEFTEVIRRIK